MDPDSEVESILRLENNGEEKEENRSRWKRPPSSYGSMKTESEGEDEREEQEREEKEQAEEMEKGNEEEVAATSLCPVATSHPEHEPRGFRLIRSASPETLYTMTTEQTRPPGAFVINIRSSDVEDSSEDEKEDAAVLLFANSPEPPEPLEPDNATQTDELQPGRAHPEQDLSHVFKSIQGTLTNLTADEFFRFKSYFLNWEPRLKIGGMMEGDTLDFVDRIIEILGQHQSLLHTLSALEDISKNQEADELRNQCKRALIQGHLKLNLIRKHQVIHEGVVRAGKQSLLDTIYVEPMISTCACGGVDPSHEFRYLPPSPLRLPGADTLVGVNNLFRLQKEDGQPVRTVLTTGIPGIGMTVSVGKYCLDWAREQANKDFQFVIKLSFRTLWRLRKKVHPLSEKMSIMEVIARHHPECKDMEYLEEEDCKFLIIMDSYDCYRAPLDWENAPVISDNHTQAHPDVLIVNIVRGSVLRGARVWILGRSAAVSQIPTELIDVVTEIQGFSDEMKDDYLNRRFRDAELAAKIVAHYKHLPTLKILARQPFVCWMAATVFENCYRYRGYGENPPRLTPFYINILVVQTNRSLEFYYENVDSHPKWSSEERCLLTKMGKMAFKMLERNTSVFFKEDVEECDLSLTEVTVFSGLCTELSTAATDGRRTFCFVHFTLQEFMAALYVFTMFHSESKNILVSGLLPLTKVFSSKSAVNLVQCALERYLNSPRGHYDMFLRFLCGLLSPECHNKQLRGFLYQHNTPKVDGLNEVQQLLEKTILSAPGDRVGNLKECLREMTQEDE